jgi:hypothetical protein
MNSKELDRLGAISGIDSYLYELASKDASQAPEVSLDDDPERMQERADDLRKDDSEPQL